jgi:hypothetical protein
MIDILAGRCTIHGMLTKIELRGGFCFACEEDGLDEHDFDEDDDEYPGEDIAGPNC